MEKGCLANLGIGTGSKTGSEVVPGRKDASQVVDLMARQTGFEPVTLGLEEEG